MDINLVIKDFFHEMESFHHEEKHITKKIDIKLIQSAAAIEWLSNNQDLLVKLLYLTVTDDQHVSITQKLWKIIKEENIGLLKYNLYCHVLKQEKFQEKTARYICLKERNMKKLSDSLLSHCGNKKAVDFLIQAYDLHINNIIEGIANCYFDEQIPIVDDLLSRLNDNQKVSALNKFMFKYLNNSSKEINLVSFVLKKQEFWNQEVLENEKVKKIIFFNKIEEKLPRQDKKAKAIKI